jgi:signal transduction histidine kinase
MGIGQQPNETCAGEIRLNQAAEYLPLGIAIFDRQPRLVMANARYRRLLGLPTELAVTGTKLIDVLALLARRGELGPGEPEALVEQRLRLLMEGPAWSFYRIKRNGQTLEFHSSRVPDGGLVLSFIDATARASAEAALEELHQSIEARVSERMATLTRVNAELEIARAKADAANLDKTRFLAAASHDLLQPLNAARLYTATLIERSGGTGLAELAHSIEASLNAVEEIMSALLDISRLDSGAMKPVAAAFAIADLLKKTEVEFAPMAREKSITLKIVGTSAAVLADRMLVARILQNLVSNAIKYTRPGGRVLVGCRRRGNRVRLDIIDTGIGFNKDQSALIFAEFSRLDRGARMAQGLGLGLSIVQRLVATMDVKLELESVEGRGSRFSLYLTAIQQARPALEAAPPIREQVSNLAGLKVLCVDNERPILDAMGGLMTGWGIDVRVALSLKEIAVDQLLVGWLPDMVLMDYHLDQASGLDAIEWLRHNVGGHLPAVLVTADRSPVVRRLAEERGVAVITKPVRPATLRAAIGSLAAQRAGSAA